MDINVEDFKGCAFFEGFSYDDIQSFIKHANVITLKKSETLFQEGESGNNMFVIHTGQLHIIKDLRKEGAKEVVARLEKGDVIGEMALFTTDLRSASVQAGDTEVVLLDVTKAILDQLEKEHPDSACKIYKSLIALMVRRFGKLSAKKDRFSFWLGG